MNKALVSTTDYVSPYEQRIIGGVGLFPFLFTALGEYLFALIALLVVLVYLRFHLASRVLSRHAKYYQLSLFSYIVVTALCGMVTHHYEDYRLLFAPVFLTSLVSFFYYLRKSIDRFNTENNTADQWSQRT